MHDFFLLIGLPYIALFSVIFVSIYRFNSNKFGFSSLSSQFLEKEKLLWGSVPWHLGIGLIILWHGVAFFAPKFLQSLVADIRILYTFESMGLIAALFAFLGLVILFIRRLRDPRIQAVTSTMDLIVLLLLTVQVFLGILTATLYKWGASWSPGTVSPYVLSILFFNPDISYVKDMPFVIKSHIVLAWLIILLIPFTRLVHMFSLPLEYLYRLPQVVIWNFREPKKAVVIAKTQAETRRRFLKAILSITLGMVLLAIGIIDKVIPFFMGPSLSRKEKAELLKKRLEKIKAAAYQKELEHERLTKDFIFIADLKSLKNDQGIYFIDYEMKPGLAFKGEDGLPMLYSAKCPHLGCTIISKAEGGKLLCPCHISHFDIKTGNVIDGPALKPLSQIKYVLKDSSNKIVTNVDKINKTKFSEYKVYIPRNEFS
ncbi:MAG: respiratory nitrate reductase subunit gamma [Candidatus Melainabacteria bacterium]|nr:respiratory nitrate reductase subunit gamma [Candidatus Melainabacteria bacterium]